eukprot:1535521-Prymnesium_polylepis.2
MFELPNLSTLRAPVEFAASGNIAARMLTSKAKQAEAAVGMLYFSRQPIPTSLTQLDPPLAKEAIQARRTRQRQRAGGRPHGGGGARGARG